MRRFRIAAALVSAGLLFSHSAIAQNEQRTERQDRQAQSSDREISENALSLKGPDGQNALQVTKSAPREVRAGEQFDYQITVRNVSDSPLQNVVVVEQVDGLEVRQAQSPKQGQGSQSNQQRRQQNQQGQNQQGQNQQGQNQQGQNQRSQNQRSQNQRSQNQRSQNQQGQGQQGQSQQGQNQQGQNQQGQNQQGQNQQGQNQNQVQQQGNTIRYQVGKLDAGQTRTLTVSAVANDAGQAHSCMWVDFQPTLCTSINVVQPDFRLVGRLLFDRDIETQGDIEGIFKCDQLKLEMAVTSTGDAATQPAQATVQLPEGLTTQDGKNQVQVDLGRIEPNKTVRKEIPLKLDPQKASDQLELQANATAGDLKAQVQLPGVKVLDPQLKLSVEAPEQAYINKPVEVPVSVTNPSQAPVLNAVVRIEAAADFDRFTAEGVEVSRDGAIALGRIEPGQSREFTLLMEASKPTNTSVNVVAEGYCVEAQRQQAKINLKGIPAVLIEVVDKVDPVPVGENTVYEIAVKNQGTALDTNIQLSATLPEQMEFVRGDGETKVTAEGKTINFAPLKEIAPGDVVSWTVQVKANSAAKARLKVELKSDAVDEPITEEEPTTLYGDSPQGQNQNRNNQNSGNQNSGNQ